MALTLEIVTPEARVYSDTVETVVIPTVEGEIGILPGHIPLLTQVEAGELRVLKNGKTELLAVGNGFAEIDGDKVSILAESAITEEKIDVDAAEKAMQRAQDALRGRETLDASEIERFEGILRSAIVQIGIKRRRI
ncbi:MAG: ATP synthase F1 subunit epsilon [Verrucomicrobia bacterium]|nr:ATP synthase F1 subunit epsilon [Verrucomicrobiota bacterium]